MERIKAIGKGAVVFDTKVLENLYQINPGVNIDYKSKEELTQREGERL